MEKYVKGKLLGKGSFGKATVVERRSDGAKFVLKEIDISRMPKQEKEASLQEAQLLKALKHPNIVSCQETFLERGILCIIMDYCSEGDLYQALQRRKGALLPEEQILDWAVQLFLGLKHVHDRKILHRDLKSQNVFISKGGILKLGDFGVSKVLNNTHHLASTAVGTPYYLSPEICQSKKYNQKSDIWSLGCLLYEMTSLKHAFEAGSLKLLIHKIIRGQYPPLSSRYSQDLRSLIDRMITKDPSKRPTINQVLQEPIIKKRIHHHLSDTLRADEFSHTMIHGRPKPGQLVANSAPPQLPASRLAGSPAEESAAADSRRAERPRPGQPARSSASSTSSSSASRQAQSRSGAGSAGGNPRQQAAEPRPPQRAVVQEQTREAKLREEAARKASEREQQRQEAEQRRVQERRRLEAEQKRIEAEVEAAEAKRRAELERAKKTAEPGARRQPEAERAGPRADDKRGPEHQKADEAKHREKDRKRREEDASRVEFLQRQREAMRTRSKGGCEIDLRLPKKPSTRPQWQDIVVPDADRDARPEKAPEPPKPDRDAAAPTRARVSDADRRRVWEENRIAAMRNRAQIEAIPSQPSRPLPVPRPCPREEPAADVSAPRPGGGPSAAEQRRLHQEQQRQAREAELREFQQRNWVEMKAAAERNRRQLIGEGRGADEGAQRSSHSDEYSVDESDIQDQAAMCQDMAWVYSNEDGMRTIDEGEECTESEDDEAEKEQLRKSLSRFYLNGKEIDLGVEADASLPARVEALRIFLENHLGFEPFVKVYQLMENVSQDDDENKLMEEIIGILGVENMMYLQLIHQLIICEESMHAGRV
uniref:non-specific serine/threonine protein kinase n=1 Tax=Tetraselmis sp. GSL018 TaxID=582737 RepID=A0A061S4H1_9CHLO